MKVRESRPLYPAAAGLQWGFQGKPGLSVRRYGHWSSAHGAGVQTNRGSGRDVERLFTPRLVDAHRKPRTRRHGFAHALPFVAQGPGVSARLGASWSR